ncbi:MAG: tRNA uridine-5-carboxymethylaminomethyl(34) synthesis GTPase MnmE, partial [Alphaproteobacteria bacterium]|nr:tRNA uridine-5-carboxymethylaminomethyl(34) synthesis GTPase MnmE [Alphaproteobacteria bacterium]
MTDTIYALASAPGRAGVAVIRVSGPQTDRMLERICRRALPVPRQAALRDFHAADETVIDRGLALWFPGPGSFTGEDSAEFHVHGGPAVISAMSEALLDAGARPAEAGEFTRRAFESGKIDLTEAEGLADLVDAETEGQRAQALAQMSGALKTLYEGWREQLVTILAAIEGEIDFPDEEDVPDALSHSAAAPLRELIEALSDH